VSTIVDTLAAAVLASLMGQHPMVRLPSWAPQAPPPEEVLGQLRIPFVRRAVLHRDGGGEEAFLIDIGLTGAFVERAEPLVQDEKIEIRFAWPGSERPFVATCRVAWWHPQGAPLSSKSLPSGAGLEFVEMSEADRDRLRSLLLDYCRQHPRIRRFLRHWPESERRGDDPTSG
jgi:hypothetical protein